METLRVHRSDHSLETSPQVQEIAVAVALVAPRRHRQDARADGDRPHQPQHRRVGRRHPPPHREPDLPPVAVHGPDRLAEQRVAAPAPATLLVLRLRLPPAALERDAEEPVAHLAGEVGGRDGELDEEEGRGAGVVLEAEADAAAAVAEEGAGDNGGAVGGGGLGGDAEGVGIGGGGGLEAAAAGDDALDEGAEGAAEADLAAAVDGGGGVDHVEGARLAAQVDHSHGGRRSGSPFSLVLRYGVVQTMEDREMVINKQESMRE